MRRFAILCGLAFAGVAAAAPDLGEVEKLVARGTNEFRVEQGRPRVGEDAALAHAARAFAEYMARTDRYGHAADGREPAERARERGYDYCLVSENISYQFSSEAFTTSDLARRYVEGWKASPGHRRNMLEPAATDMAVAVAQSARSGRYYGVQMFGRPRTQAIEFRILNAAGSAVRYRMGGKEYALRPNEERIHGTCAPEDVTFPAAGNGEGRTIRPSHGDRLRVDGDRRLRVRVER